MKSSLFLSLSLGVFFLLTGNIIIAQKSFSMSQIGPNNLLDKPWDLNYGPDGYLWITEREAGVVVRVNPEDGERDELIKIADLSSTASQDGLLGMAIHEELLGDSPFVYLSYTYLFQGQRRQSLVRYTYEIEGSDGKLDPDSEIKLIDELPSSNDHNSGRLIFGPDGKLYYSIGDQGGNQNANFCNPILSQFLPTQEEIDQFDWSHYPGKILRLNTDGSIPEDNPSFNGVQSHIYSIGHRNAQGLVFGSNGLLYSDEHGPNTDDEVNLISAGSNYGWPNVVGFQDDQAYDYCNWSSVNNCADLNYSNGSCPPNASIQEESSFSDSTYREPLFSLFAVPDNYNFNNPACENSWICRPNVAPSSLAIYESDAIPGWKNSLLVSSLKRGRIFRLKLNEDGSAVVGDTTHHFYTQNRYRDIAMAPDGKSFYIITDQGGRTSDQSGLDATSNLQNPGAILKFTFQESVSLDNELDKLISVWPNPSKGQLFIEIERQVSNNLSGELLDFTGQLVKELDDLKSGTNEADVQSLPAGVYMLRIVSKDKIWQKRVILY